MIQTTKTILKGTLLMIALSGCRHADDKATPSAKAPTAKAPTKALSVKTPSVKASSPAPVKMTASQTLGLDILKALNADSTMKGHTISVGTDKSTVMLNGNVKTAAQKHKAEAIARQKAKGCKIVNALKISTS